MAKYVIDEEILQRLANAIREVSGTDRSYTPEEMVDAVSTILENGVYILVDENGNEVPAVFVDNEQVFTATANDIRIGTTAVTEKGVTEGTREIPTYYVAEGYRLILAGRPFLITANEWEYTKLQAIICPFNTTLANSVSAEKVAIDNSVYNVLSTESISAVVKDTINKRVDLGLSNDTSNRYLVRYFMYKEVY